MWVYGSIWFIQAFGAFHLPDGEMWRKHNNERFPSPVGNDTNVSNQNDSSKSVDILAQGQSTNTKTYKLFNKINCRFSMASFGCVYCLQVFDTELGAM